MIYDPDYARAYSIIRCIAWSYGYAACLHGSFTRDLDVVLVPWTDADSRDVDALIKYLADCTGTTAAHPPSDKPHGRKAWSLHFKAFGDPRWIDISVMPRLTTPPSHNEQEAPK